MNSTIVPLLLLNRAAPLRPDFVRGQAEGVTVILWKPFSLLSSTGITSEPTAVARSIATIESLLRCVS